VECGYECLSDQTELIIDGRVSLGKGITFGPYCKKIQIGYGSFLGNDIYIDVPELTIGEYTTIHKNTTIHGYQNCSIGNNCWIGQFCIIDSIGGTTIENNVGIGASSQLWSHVKFGDTLAGCRWNSAKQLIIKEDVWLVGHCIVSPITANKKSMLMVGGVITKDMEENCIYAGVPAKNITDKLGHQFSEFPLVDKMKQFNQLYYDYLEINGLGKDDFPITVIDSIVNFVFDDTQQHIPVFFIKERLYQPVRSLIEYKFMKYLLYDKAKFNPY
jgi:acetyltransferase-like isoleucine patch superfamily enzyme